MDNIKGAICFPNHFEDGIAKEVIAICKVSITLFDKLKINFKNFFEE